MALCQPARWFWSCGKLSSLLLVCLLFPPAGSADEGGSFPIPLRVRESDGAPDVFGVSDIIVSNATLTDDGGGTITLGTGSGGGSGTITGVTAGAGLTGGGTTGTVTVTVGAGTAITVNADDVAVTADGIGPTQVDETANYAWSGIHTYPSGTFSAGAAARVVLPWGLAPTTDVAGRIAFDANAWGNERGTIQLNDGLANGYLVNILASDTCTNGQVAKFNTGGTWTCEADAGGSSNSFETWAVPDANNIVADSSTDTATFTETAGFDITGNSGTDTVNFAVDLTEVNTLTLGAGAFTTLTLDAGASDPTFSAASGFLSLTTGTLGINTVLQIPNGTSPTVDASGELAQDFTDNQLLFGLSPNVLTPWEVSCSTIENLVAADDNLLLLTSYKNVTVTHASCRTSGFTTQPTVSLEDDSANALTGAPTCNATATQDWTAVTAGGALTAEDALRFDTTNTPDPITGTQTNLCVRFTYDRS